MRPDFLLAGYSSGSSGSKDGTPVYRARKVETLAEIAKATDAQVIDIRLYPGSTRFPQWNRFSITKAFSDLDTVSRYSWWGDVWGNPDRFSNGHGIRISDFPRGLERYRRTWAWVWPATMCRAC